MAVRLSAPLATIAATVAIVNSSGGSYNSFNSVGDDCVAGDMSSGFDGRDDDGGDEGRKR